MNPARRLVGAVAAGVLGLLLAASPAGAVDPTVEWTRPTIREPVLRAQEPITGSVTTRAEDDQGVTGLEFELMPGTLSTDPEDPCLVDVPEDERLQEFPERPPSVTFDLDLTFPCNLAYELRLVVRYDEELVAVPVPETTEDTLSFSVAIPPPPVEGLTAAYDPATKKVDLSWAAQDDPDFLRYEVERNPPGPEGFLPLGTATGATYADTLTLDEEHRYQVTAVYRGPEGSELRGEPSAAVAAGPDTPEPTIPDAPADRRRGTGGSTAGGGAAARPRTRATVDDGFGRNLPFDPNATTSLPPTRVPAGDAAVVAQFDDSDEDDRRGVLIPVAGGLALIVGAAHLALLSKRAAEPDIPILTR